MAFCVSLLEARAQLSVELILDQQQFLKDESMPIKVKITNRSGQTLHFGKESDWLTFSVDSRDGSLVSKLREVSVSGEFDLESATVATREVDVMPCFDFSQPGRYNVAATIKVHDWDKEISSKPAVVEVKRGSQLHRQRYEKGIPQGDVAVVGTAQGTGTTVTYKADATIFTTDELDQLFAAVRRTLERLWQ